MEQLIIAWDPASDSCDWMLLDGNGNRQGAVNRESPVEGLPRDNAGRKVAWLLPGARARAISARIPARGRDKILRALPFALEESFAADPDALFFALADTSGPDQQAVAVERRVLEQGLAALQEHGLRPQHILPDYLALPRAANEWTVLSDAGMLYVREGPAAGFAIENSVGWQVLEERLSNLAEEDGPHRLRYIRGRDPLGPEPELERLEADTERQAEGLLGVVPQGLASPLAIDLRQGEFSLKKDWLPQLRPWLPAAAALGVVALAGLAAFGANWYQAARARTTLMHTLRTRYEQVLPQSRWQGQSYAREIIESKLRQQGNGASQGAFLDLLAAVASASQSNAAIKIESITYNGGQLELHVHAPTVSALDDLRGELAKAGAETSVRSANQTASGVEGSLMINGGGAS